MSIWKQPFTVERLNEISQNTAVEWLEIRFTGFGDDYLEVEMPVSHKQVQPMRILHGGVSVAVAETLGSVASLLCLPDIARYQAVGLDINANHLRSVSEGGKIKGRCTPIHIGRTTHVWHIELKDERDRLVCISRLTMAIRSNEAFA